MKPITVVVTVAASREKVWECWNEPRHITQWAFASDDWEASAAKNDLRIGGKFSTTMRAKDGSASFDFEGTYTAVRPYEYLKYVMSDGRQVEVVFEEVDRGIKVTEVFDPENENTEEVQRSGWQAILNNFKKYVDHLV